MNIPLSAYWQLLRRYLKPQSGAVLLMVALLLASIGLQLVEPQVARSFIDAVQGKLKELLKQHILLIEAPVFEGL